MTLQDHWMESSETVRKREPYAIDLEDFTHPTPTSQRSEIREPELRGPELRVKGDATYSLSSKMSTIKRWLRHKRETLLGMFILEESTIGKQTFLNMSWGVLSRRILYLLRGFIWGGIIFSILWAGFVYSNSIVIDQQIPPWRPCDPREDPLSPYVVDMIQSKAKERGFFCSTQNSSSYLPCLCCLDTNECFRDVYFEFNSSRGATVVDRVTDVNGIERVLSRRVPYSASVCYHVVDGSLEYSCLQESGTKISNLLRAIEMLHGWPSAGDPVKN